MRAYFDDHDGAGFAYAMLYPGMQRVVQAAGRVIRTMDDRGVVVLLDRRFGEPPYADCLPPDWYRHDPRELLTDDPAAELAGFWGSDRQTPASTPRCLGLVDARE
jgi:Rad3-related DNA helicase